MAPAPCAEPDGGRGRSRGSVRAGWSSAGGERRRGAGSRPLPPTATPCRPRAARPRGGAAGRSGEARSGRLALGPAGSARGSAARRRRRRGLRDLRSGSYVSVQDPWRRLLGPRGHPGMGAGRPSVSTGDRGHQARHIRLGWRPDHVLAATIMITASRPCVSADGALAVTSRGRAEEAGPVKRGRRRGSAASVPRSHVSAPGPARHHAEALDRGAADQVHRLDHRPVREPRVGLEVQRLVGPVLERRAQLRVEPARRDTLVVDRACAPWSPSGPSAPRRLSAWPPPWAG